VQRHILTSLFDGVGQDLTGCQERFAPSGGHGAEGV
jgi:hypothetical protein